MLPISTTDITQRQEPKAARHREVDSAESEEAEQVEWGVGRGHGAMQHGSRDIIYNEFTSNQLSTPSISCHIAGVHVISYNTSINA